ncbi:MAG TPA: NAD-dependent epimerase/dehydratase family protein [Gemmatimonadales bacterium]|nr:NAD-dependent epimerase/dehydratase family protein [Gemmatimonadales bacterium]
MSILVTGGAGFVGCHLVHDLLGDNRKVTVLDSLSRRGSERNLEWLQQQHPDGDLRFVKGDVRDPQAVKSAAADVDAIYHLAGQVAVTSSVQDPRVDFEINALGTLNVLEAARQSPCQPVVMFTSTNKVYGGMEDVALVEKDTSYEYRDLPDGIPESRPLDFHSPYGCSKGAADQYVRDYARIYGLRTVVFRMSCIYGPRQFGNEDQGWLAHFIISAGTGAPITIYGDGKQVRDVLFVEDLVRALRGAVDKISVTAGKVYNIGGGPANTLSVWQEFGRLLAELSGEAVTVSYRDWRPGDQPCYVSDIRNVGRDLGWKPEVDKRAGIRRLWEWVSSNKEVFRTGATVRAA